MSTCYAPVRRCTHLAVFSLDLHVLGTPPAFVLSQDQTLQLFLIGAYPALIHSSSCPAKGHLAPLKVHAGTAIPVRLVSSCSPVFKDPVRRPACFQRRSCRRSRLHRPCPLPAARLLALRPRSVLGGRGVYRFASASSSLFFHLLVATPSRSRLLPSNCARLAKFRFIEGARLLLLASSRVKRPGDLFCLSL